MLTATFPFAQCFVSLKIRIYSLLIETCYSVVLVYQQNASWSCICCGLDSCSYYDRGWVLSPTWYEKNRFLGKSIAKKRNPLLSRNRLIKCHSTVSNKYLLHDICVAGMGFSKTNQVREPVLTRVGWKLDVRHCGLENSFPSLLRNDNLKTLVASHQNFSPLQLTWNCLFSFIWRHILLFLVFIFSMPGSPPYLLVLFCFLNTVSCFEVWPHLGISCS